MVRRTRDQMKAELLCEAEGVIDELLDWNDQVLAPTLTQLEEVVLELRERLGQRMSEVVLSKEEATQPAVKPACSVCGEEGAYKGRKKVVVESRLGALELERGYYYCPHCQRGFFPPGRAT